MGEKEKALRERVAENLRIAGQLGRRVERIRNLFEAKLREHPLTTWSPTIYDFRRREIYAYEGCKLRSEFRVGDLVGGYDLMLYADGTDLANSQIEVRGVVGGDGYVQYVLPSVTDIMKLDRSDLDESLEEVNHLELLLRLIGVLPDEEIDSEED